MRNIKSSEDIFFEKEVENEDIDFKNIFKKFKRRRRIILAFTISCFTLASIYTGFKRIFSPTFQGNFTLLVNDPEKSTEISTKSALLEGLPESYRSALADRGAETDLDTLIEVLKSSAYLKPLAQEFNLNYPSLKRRIEISTIAGYKRNLGVLEIELKSKNPSKDKQLLNRIKDTYLMYSLDERQSKLKKSLEFINKQYPKLEQDASILYKQIAKLRIENKFLQPIGTRLGYTVENTRSISQKLFDYESALQALEGNKEALINLKEKLSSNNLSLEVFLKYINNNASNAEMTPIRSYSDELNIFFKEVLNLEKKLAKARSIYLPSSSKIKSLEMALQKLSPALKKAQFEAVDSALARNKLEIENTKKQKQYFEDIFAKQPEFVEKYESLSRQLFLTNSRIASLNEDKQNTLMEIEEKKVPWKLINPPQFGPIPIKPDVDTNLIIGLFGGLIIGIIIAYIRDNFDDSYHESLTIGQDLKLPIYGEIPFIQEPKMFNNTISRTIGNSKDLKISNSTEIEENLKSIYTSIKLLKNESNVSTICITSSETKEGKSTILYLLAKTLSNLGLKILVIDSNLRDPKLHKFFNIDNDIGLSNILKNKNLKWKDALKQTKEFKNISFLTSGSIDDDPFKLISSDNLEQILINIKDSNLFNYVLIDSPKISNLSDVLFLSKVVDNTLLVVSKNYISTNLAKEAKEKLTDKKIDFSGLVINNPKTNYYDFKNKDDQLSLFSKIIKWVDVKSS